MACERVVGKDSRGDCRDHASVIHVELFALSFDEVYRPTRELRERKGSTHRTAPGLLRSR